MTRLFAGSFVGLSKIAKSYVLPDEVAVELQRLGRALHSGDVYLADVPAHERARMHAEVAEQRREVRILDVDLADLDRDALLERAHLDVADLRHAVGDVELDDRHRHDASSNRESRR